MEEKLAYKFVEMVEFLNFNVMMETQFQVMAVLQFAKFNGVFTASMDQLHIIQIAST